MKIWIIILVILLVISVVLNVILVIKMRKNRYEQGVMRKVMMSHFD